MPSQLSSLLVRDGLATPRRIERALTHQVAHGGALDTVLLELGEITEERLTHYLSLATGLPPASKGETDIFDAEAIRRCPADVAETFQVAPLAVNQSVLKVLVCEPVEQGRLQELADQIGMSLQPLIAPEYRFRVVYARIYGQETRERFSALAHRQQDVTFAAMAGARPVILESANPADFEQDKVVVDVDESAATRDLALEDVRAAAGKGKGKADDTRPTIREMAAVAPPEEEGEEVAAEEPAQAAEEPAQAAEEPAQAAEEPAQAAAQPAQAAAQPAQAAAQPAQAAAHAEGIANEEPEELELHGPPPLKISEAREALGVSEDRDEIFELLLRGLRSLCRYAALLTIQGKSAIGRISLHDGSFESDQIEDVLVPLDTPSAYKNTFESAAPFIGPMASGDADIDAMTARLGGELPATGMLLPVALRGRVVAIAVAHSGQIGRWIGAASKGFVLASDTADAIERLLASKAKKKRDGTPEPVGEGDDKTTKVDSKKRRRRRRADAEGAR